MKKWIYASAAAALPLAYVLLMHVTDEPIDWTVLAFMALVILPIFVFSKRIGALEKQVNAMSDSDKLKVIGKTAATVARRASGQE